MRELRTSIGLTMLLAAPLIGGGEARAERRELPPGGASLFTTETLAPDQGALTVSSGLAFILPLFAVEGGTGLGAGFDAVGRFETVLGILHFAHLGVRYSPGRFGNVQPGARLTFNGSLFGLASDNINLTSTLYLTPELGLTVFVTDHTRLVAGVGVEIDVVNLRVVDDDDSAEAELRYDSTNPRLGFQTTFTEDLDLYAALRLRVPVETLRYEAAAFYVIPLIEAGLAWTF